MRARLAQTDRQPRPRPLLATYHAFCARILRADGTHVRVPSTFVIYDTADQLKAARLAIDEFDYDKDSIPPRSLVWQIGQWKNQDAHPAGAASNREELPQRTARRRVRALREDPAQSRRARLRRPAAQGRLPVAAPRQGPREVRGPLPPHPGRRVPGHQPRPVRADPPARPGPPQRLRGRRPGPGHLRLARRRHPQHPGIRERLPRARGRQSRAQLRSSGNIVTAAAALIAHNEDRADKTLWTGRSPGAGIEHLRTKSDHDEADTSPGSSPHSRTPRGRPPCSTGPTRSRASSRTRCAAS